MDIVLVDTSVWINFFKGHETPSSTYLKNHLSHIIIATCPVVVQEVLQGILADKEFTKTKYYFDALVQLKNNPYELALEAVTLYREIRKKGFTIRKPNDCLIACYAIKNNVKLLHDDRDFFHIAQNSSLDIEIN